MRTVQLTLRECHVGSFWLRILRRLASAGLLVPLLSCGGAAVVPDFIPFFVFAYEGVDAGQRKFVLALTPADTATKTAGSFDPGASNMQKSAPGDFSSGGGAEAVTGTFSKDSFEISVGSFGDKYTGKFVREDSIELRPAGSSEVIVLTRNENGQFLPRMSDTWTFQGDADRLLQLHVLPDASDEEATVRVEGVEVLAGTVSRVTGFASVSYVQVDIERPGGTVREKGRFSRQGDETSSNLVQLASGANLVRGGTPDPQRVVFTSSEGFSRTLFDVDAKALDRVTVVINDPSLFDVVKFAVSPDGSRIAFIAQNSSQDASDLFVWNRSGKTLARMTQLAQGKGRAYDFAWAPSSQQLAVIGDSAPTARARVQVVPITAGQAIDVAEVAGVDGNAKSLYRVAWSPSGTYLAFIANITSTIQSDLFVTRADGSQRRAVAQMTASGLDDFAWAPTGDRLAFRSSAASGVPELAVASVFDQSIGVSLVTPTASAPWNIYAYAWARVGNQLAFITDISGKTQLWKFDPLSAGRTEVSNAVSAPDGVVADVVWALDGNRLVYLPYYTGKLVIADGVAPPDVFDDANAQACNFYSLPFAWSPDATRVAYFRSKPSGYCELATFNLQTRQWTTISSEVAALGSIKWLADGKRVAYLGSVDIDGRPDARIAYDTGPLGLQLSDLFGGGSWVDVVPGYEVR